MPETSDGSAVEPTPLEAAVDLDRSEVVCAWTARKVRPVVLVSVLGVFAAFMLFAHFVFHSTEAAAALAMAAVAAVVPLVPAVRARVEYRLTEASVGSRPATPDRPRPFTRLFDIAELSHVVAMHNGFACQRPLGTASLFRAFWRRHLSDACSGEVRVEAADRERVLGAFSRLGVPVR